MTLGPPARPVAVGFRGGVMSSGPSLAQPAGDEDNAGEPPSLIASWALAATGEGFSSGSALPKRGRGKKGPKGASVLLSNSGGRRA